MQAIPSLFQTNYSRSVVLSEPPVSASYESTTPKSSSSIRTALASRTRRVSRKLGVRSFGTTSHSPPEGIFTFASKVGPYDEPFEHTSERAAIRAAIAALQFTEWSKEPYTSVVIATDSDYVVRGATEYGAKWASNDWRTSRGQSVQNRDLWELLLKVVANVKQQGVTVSFWRIDPACNKQAEALAKEAAVIDEIHPICIKFGGSNIVD